MNPSVSDRFYDLKHPTVVVVKSALRWAKERSIVTGQRIEPFFPSPPWGGEGWGEGWGEGQGGVSFTSLNHEIGKLPLKKIS